MSRFSQAKTTAKAHVMRYFNKYIVRVQPSAASRIEILII
jgi:hypothetical protein